MFRQIVYTVCVFTSFPHTRGDVPWLGLFAVCAVMFSPHAWGCSLRASFGIDSVRVFPTRVGMFREPAIDLTDAASFPHTRGDVPAANKAIRAAKWFSPHAWGCSGQRRPVRLHLRVFPTRVGMFRSGMTNHATLESFPHTRGDVPFGNNLGAPIYRFSPHAWGCSANPRTATRTKRVFPTRVGMF